MLLTSLFFVFRTTINCWKRSHQSSSGKSRQKRERNTHQIEIYEKSLRFRTYGRKMQLQKWTKPVERDIFLLHKEMAKDGIVKSPLSPDFKFYTAFQLKFFTRKLDIWTQEKITRLSFDAFIRKQKAINDMIDRISPKGKTNLIFYGGARQSSNSPIKG